MNVQRKDRLKGKQSAIIAAGVAVLIAVGIVAVVLVRRCMKSEEDSLPMEETMAIIEEVRLRGEVYVCSALIEDYTMRRATEENLFWADEEHACVQTMTQKCSYKIDLDRVEYKAIDSLKTVMVKLPPVEYVASTQSAAFLSDDSDFWAGHISSANDMKRKVEEQIRRRFDTAENRRKAERFAKEAISDVIEKLGYEVEFVGAVEKRKE